MLIVAWMFTIIFKEDLSSERNGDYVDFYSVPSGPVSPAACNKLSEVRSIVRIIVRSIVRRRTVFRHQLHVVSYNYIVVMRPYNSVV
jgi:hypothetical protein